MLQYKIKILNAYKQTSFKKAHKRNKIGSLAAMWMKNKYHNISAFIENLEKGTDEPVCRAGIEHT